MGEGDGGGGGDGDPLASFLSFCGCCGKNVCERCKKERAKGADVWFFLLLGVRTPFAEEAQHYVIQYSQKKGNGAKY